VAKAVIIMANVLLRDESKFDVSEQPLDFWPVRTLMAPADECEYTYHELINVLDGKTSPEDYQGISSAYKLLANDVSVVKDVVPGYESGKQLSIEDFNMENFGDFQRMYSLLIGDRPYATTTVDKKTRSCVFSQTPTMESKWSNLLSMEKEMVMKVITGKSDISAYDEFIKKWKAEGGDTILQEVAELQ
jgi:putative aldouronate transport system substrate-binding protein